MRTDCQGLVHSTPLVTIPLVTSFQSIHKNVWSLKWCKKQEMSYWFAWICGFDRWSTFISKRLQKFDWKRPMENSECNVCHHSLNSCGRHSVLESSFPSSLEEQKSVLACVCIGFYQLQEMSVHLHNLNGNQQAMSFLACTLVAFYLGQYRNDWKDSRALFCCCSSAIIVNGWWFSSANASL